MRNEEYEFILFDRLEKIRSEASKCDFNKEWAIALSGGKDSLALHHLIDEALPNNDIARVCVNVPLEPKILRDFQLSLKGDKRIHYIVPKQNINEIWTKYGYPFKSKEHAQYVYQFQKNGIESKTVQRYLFPKKDRITYRCPELFRYQFTEECKLKISAKCCELMKEKPSDDYMKELGIKVKLTGLRKEEGGLRASQNSCMSKNKDFIVFKPLIVCNDEFVDEYIKRHNIKLCALYYPPYNFKRTGCIGCPNNLHLQEDLNTIYELLPTEYKKCLIRFGKVYDEYIRIGYRLKYYPHKVLTIFDFIEEKDISKSE